MQWLTWAFLGAVTAETLTRLWLGSRHIAAVQSHRNEIPEPFRGQVALEDQQQAADYPAARVRLGRYATLVEAVVKGALTLGGGLALLDELWRRTTVSEPWRGVCVVASLLLLLQLVGLPFSLWRTFGIEARFGFNRMTPRLYAVDFASRCCDGAARSPLLLATLTLMERAGPKWWRVWSIWLVWTLAGPGHRSSLRRHRLSPLDDAALKQRLETLLDATILPKVACSSWTDHCARRMAARIYRHRRNKRIMFFDTLLRGSKRRKSSGAGPQLGHLRCTTCSSSWRYRCC